MKIVGFGIISLFCAAVHAMNSAPSSHMGFNDRFDGDIIIGQVRVPKDGETRYTYYETLGWSGKAGGYAGIQTHPRAHNFIFSIWDHKDHTAPIKAVYRGPGTETKLFGGEGTGLKSWNFELGWSVDVWYTLVARNWVVDDHTHYAFWAQAGDTGKWTHLVTMDVAVANERFRGGTNAFIEDWVNSGKNPRSIHLRKGWKRKMDGSWFAQTQARYSVNSWDLKEGKRSYHFRNSWNGGIGKDETGPFYFMSSGGDTKSTVNNPSKYRIPRSEKAPEFATLRIRELTAVRDGKSLLIEWQNEPETLPQFAYQIDVYDTSPGAGEPLLSTTEKLAHVRSATVGLPSKRSGPYYIHLRCIDVLDGTSEGKVIEVK